MSRDQPWRKVEARVVHRPPPEKVGSELMFEGRRLVGEDFSHQRIYSFTSVGSRFESCDFSGVVIEHPGLGAGLKQSFYVDCVFDGSRLEMIYGGGNVRFERCSFREVKFRDWYCKRVEMVDCTFTGTIDTAVFYGTVPKDDVRYAKRKKNEFRGNDFSGATLIGVDFRTGIDLTLQKLPIREDYVYIEDLAAAVQRARPLLEALPASEQRRHALGFLELYEDDARGGQRQVFTTLVGYKGRDRETYRIVHEAMGL